MEAILVIDMPSDCNHCQFADFSNGQWECNQHKGGRIGESMKICSTPSWCPLKPMPQKKKHSEQEDTAEDDYEDEYDYWEIEGYNACLDEIMGETE